MSANETPGVNWVTDSNKGSIVSVVTWVLIVFIAFSICVRLGTRFAVLRTIYIDDFTITVALLLAIGQTVATSIQSTSGTGRFQANLSPDTIIKFEKSGYASAILYVLCLGFTKVSVTLYLYALTPVRIHRVIAAIVGGSIVLWTIASVFVVSFQCSLPQAWALLTEKCIDTQAFWTFYNVFNIVTDMAVVILPFFILTSLQMRLTRKVLVIGCFAIRLFVVGAVAAQTYFLRHDLSPDANGSLDYTYQYWRVSLMNQIVLALSMITACAPYLKPFLAALDTHMLTADNVPRAMGYGGISLEYPGGSVLMSRANHGPSNGNSGGKGYRPSPNGTGKKGVSTNKSDGSGFSARLKAIKEKNFGSAGDSELDTDLRSGIGLPLKSYPVGGNTQRNDDQVYGANGMNGKHTAAIVAGAENKTRAQPQRKNTATARHHHEQSSDIDNDEDASSETSRSRIIKKTIGFAVNHDNNDVEAGLGSGRPSPLAASQANPMDKTRTAQRAQTPTQHQVHEVSVQSPASVQQSPVPVDSAYGASTPRTKRTSDDPHDVSALQGPYDGQGKPVGTGIAI